MIERIKFGSFALIGLLIGVALALPLFWFGVKHGVAALHESATRSFEAVESRQQNMANESLRLERLLASLGTGAKYRQDFVKVDLLRSRLAGSYGLAEKSEASQELEGALLQVEKDLLQLTAKSKKLASNPYLAEFGRTWGTLKRYLVAEEADFTDAVEEYNAILKRWPVPMVLKHRTIRSLFGAFLSGVRYQSADYLRQGWRWTAWGAEALVDRILKREIPEFPAPMPVTGSGKELLFQPLPEPEYLAKAPRPEEDYPEIQYNRSYPNMADTGVGEDRVELENDYVKPYAAPVPTQQKTVIYR